MPFLLLPHLQPLLPPGQLLLLCLQPILQLSQTPLFRQMLLLLCKPLRLHLRLALPFRFALLLLLPQLFLMLPRILSPCLVLLLPGLLRAQRFFRVVLQFLRQRLGNPGQTGYNGEWNDKSALGFAHGDQP